MKKIFKHPSFWGILAALVIIVPQMNLFDFLGTDSLHIGVLKGSMDYPGMSSFNLYRFADGNPELMSEIVSRGYYPWFASLHWKVIFARHLPSLLIAANYKICGMKPLGYIIHTLLWYIALIVLLGIMMDRLLRPLTGKAHHPAAYLALIFFAFSTSHIEVVFYGAARWLFIVGTLAVLALLAHLKWREDNWKPGRYLSIIAIVLALFSGEAALAALAYLAAYELFGTTDVFKKRIRALLPVIILAFVYLCCYKLMGYGTGGQDFYINPLSQPLTFIKALPIRMASILGEMFFRTLSVFEMNPTLPGFDMKALLIGIGVLLVFGMLFLPVWKNASTEIRRKFKWLIIGTFGAMIPLASGYPCPRVTLIPFMGGSILLAYTLYYWWQRLTAKESIRNNIKKPMAWVAGLVCIGFIFINMGYSPYNWFTKPQILKVIKKISGEFNRGNTVLDDIQPHHEVIFLNFSSDVDLTYDYFYYRKLMGLPLPGTWWQLSYSKHKHRYLRPAENKLVLEITEGNVYDGYPVLFVLRSKKDFFKAGDVIRFSSLTIKILQVNQEGPVKLEYTFPTSLDDEKYRFFKLQKEKLLPIDLPPVGGSISL